MSQFNHQDALKVRDHITNLIKTAIPDALGKRVVVKVLTTTVTHDRLFPEGDLFSIQARVEVHPQPTQEQRN